MKVGVLALQGSVSEHRLSMERLNVDVVDVREPSDMNGLKGLIMPGGESTTLRKLLVNSGLWDTISGSGIPIMATCAGAILMGKSDETTFEKMDFRIDRNYYGRQKDSFEKEIRIGNNQEFRGIFIRAPAIVSVGDGTEAIAWDGEMVVGCMMERHMALTFHPELNDDLTFHQMWFEGL
jgi:5'-phosphate synthase pdxT subunit